MQSELRDHEEEKIKFETVFFFQKLHLFHAKPKVLVGALIIRIGFGAHCTISIIRNPHNSIGNH